MSFRRRNRDEDIIDLELYELPSPRRRRIIEAVDRTQQVDLTRRGGVVDLTQKTQDLTLDDQALSQLSDAEFSKLFPLAILPKKVTRPPSKAPSLAPTQDTPKTIITDLDCIKHGPHLLRPRRAVELYDGSFLRIVSIKKHVIVDDSCEIFLEGPTFQRTKCFNGLLALKLNEVAMDSLFESVPLSSVDKPRILILTNENYPAFRDTTRNGQPDEDNGRLVCRWRIDLVSKQEGYISRLLSFEADQCNRIDDSALRDGWRGDLVRAVNESNKRKEINELAKKKKELEVRERELRNKNTTIDLTGALHRPRSMRWSEDKRHSVIMIDDSTVDLTETLTIDNRSSLTEGSSSYRADLRSTNSTGTLSGVFSATYRPITPPPIQPLAPSLSLNLSPKAFSFPNDSNSGPSALPSPPSMPTKSIYHPPGMKEQTIHMKPFSFVRSARELASFHRSPFRIEPHRVIDHESTGSQGTLPSTPKRSSFGFNRPPASMPFARIKTIGVPWTPIKKGIQKPPWSAPLSSRTRSMDLSILSEPPPPQPDFMQHKYTFGDAFCGGGGMSSGARSAGFINKWSFDFNTDAINTYRKNFPDCESYQATVNDFVKMPPEDLLVDVVHLSPPCQPHSPAHTVAGKDDDRNEASLFCVGDTLKASRPRFVTLEQTDGILNRPEWFRSLIMSFTDVGFSVSWKVLRGLEYGLPQNRRRLFVLASSPGEPLPLFPSPKYAHPSDPKTAHRPRARTLRDAFSSITPDCAHHNFNPFTNGPRIPTADLDKYLNSTILASGGPYDIHPNGLRPFTVRELACLQTFPVTHNFEGSDYQRKKQIGNAVPPILSKALLREVRNALLRGDRERSARSDESGGVFDVGSGDGDDNDDDAVIVVGSGMREGGVIEILDDADHDMVIL